MINSKLSELLLDEEEKELLNSFDNDEWKTVETIKEEKEKALKAATRYLQKDKRINIRISSSDLKRIKQRAAYEGLPYQKPQNYVSDGLIGLDLNVSNIAFVADNHADLLPFADKVPTFSKEITKLQRQMQRSQRANNPDNLNLSSFNNNLGRSRRRSCQACAALKVKCDLRQPCSSNFNQTLLGHLRLKHGRGLLPTGPRSREIPP